MRIKYFSNENFEWIGGWFFITCIFPLLSLICFMIYPILVGVFSEPTYSICFTPSNICSDQIIDEIDKSHETIYVMAYGFTSKHITDALLRANERGVKISVLLDKSNASTKKNIPESFVFYKIPVYIDYKPPIAHNKVIIIDDNLTITGSYNFTGNAEKNAENVIFIRDTKVANTYKENWMYRHSQSIHLKTYNR